MEAKFCIRCGSHLETLIYRDGHPHPVCPSCGWAYFPDPKVAAAVVVLMDDKILLVQRHFDPMKGFWALPAGFVNAEEDPAQAAVRECSEETGLIVENKGLLNVITGRDHPRGADVILVYQAEVIGGQLAAHDDAENVGFFKITDPPPLAFRATHEVIDNLRENLK